MGRSLLVPSLPLPLWFTGRRQLPPGRLLYDGLPHLPLMGDIVQRQG